VLLFLAIIVPIAFASLQLTASKTMREANAYASLFYGTLSFSSDPLAILRKLNLGEGIECVNKNTSTEQGYACLERFGSRSSFGDTLRSIYYDPSIIVHQMAFGASNIQILTMNNLGKFALDGPANNSALHINMWSSLKSNYFPKGFWYFISIGVLATFFLLSWLIHPDPLLRLLSKLGLMLAIASPLDMYVAVLGDGKRDILKHLFSSNFTYDLAVVFFLAVLGVVLSNGVYFLRRDILGKPSRSGMVVRGK
jgi:hypothetical protein